MVRVKLSAFSLSMITSCLLTNSANASYISSMTIAPATANDYHINYTYKTGGGPAAETPKFVGGSGSVDGVVTDNGAGKTSFIGFTFASVSAGTPAGWAFFARNMQGVRVTSAYWTNNGQNVGTDLTFDAEMTWSIDPANRTHLTIVLSASDSPSLPLVLDSFAVYTGQDYTSYLDSYAFLTSSVVGSPVDGVPTRITLDSRHRHEVIHLYQQLGTGTTLMFNVFNTPYRLGIEPVPEPSTWILSALGVITIILTRSARKNRPRHATRRSAELEPGLHSEPVTF